MTLIYIETGEAWNGEPLNDAFYPASIAKNMTDEKLAALGLQRKPADPLPPPRPVSIADIEEETGNRISRLFPIHKQLNSLAATSELILIGPANWTTAQQELAVYLKAARAWIAATRAAGDVLEVSLPADYKADKHWPSFPLTD